MYFCLSMCFISCFLFFFLLQDYTQAFGRVSSDGYHISYDDLQPLLEDVYHGEVSPEDLEIFVSLFEGMDTITQRVFDEKLVEMRRLCEEKREQLEEYCSKAIESVQLSEFNLMKKYHHTQVIHCLCLFHFFTFSCYCFFFFLFLFYTKISQQQQ